MHYTIYQITNKIDGKIYIGKHQTKDLDDGYMGSGKRLRYAIEKYGIENFEKKILHVFAAEDQMNAMEAELVTEEFCAREDTYNICPGGHGGWGYINQNTVTIRPNNGKNGFQFGDKNPKFGKVPWNKGIQMPNSFRKQCSDRQKLGGHFLGKTHSDEWKQAHSIRMKSQPILECPKCGLTTTNRGNYNRWHGDNCKKNSLHSV